MLLATEPRTRPDGPVAAAAGLVVAGTISAVLGHAHSASGTTLLVAALVGSLPAVLTAIAVARRRPRSTTPADRVTLTRAVLASGCGAITVLVLAGAVPARTWWLLALTVPTLVLDAVDGLVARRTGTSSRAGARLDMEVDAGVLVVLSLVVAPVLGVWVLLIGALRYLFVVASWLRPALRTHLPRSQFRRVVAGLQGAALAFAIAPVVPISLARAAVLVALGLLLASFGSQVFLQERQARAVRDVQRRATETSSNSSLPPARSFSRTIPRPGA